MPRVTIAFLLVTTLALASCATLRKAGASSVTMVRNSTSAATAKLTNLSITRLLPGQGPRVVEVREQDLKELPTGTELAQAHEKERRSGFWIFGGPVDFKEPTLPEPGAELDGSLLPPRMP